MTPATPVQHAKLGRRRRFRVCFANLDGNVYDIMDWDTWQEAQTCCERWRQQINEHRTTKLPVMIYDRDNEEAGDVSDRPCEECNGEAQIKDGRGAMLPCLDCHGRGYN